jgi:adenylate cyclase
LIKTIGDAVLIASRDPGAAVALVDRLFTEAAHEAEFPALRAGLHHGGAILRDGDVFGAAVNLAARVAAEAFAGEVLGTDAIANAARDQGLPVAEIGPVSLKNVRGTVPLFSIVLVLGAAETPSDPVCHARVDRRGAAGHLHYRGTDYWFCSLACAAAFASNPRWHIEVAGT